VTCGVSQGSVLGPFLFVIFINDLNKKIMNDSKFYADDTKVISIIKNLLDGNIFQNDIKILVDWSNEWSIKFNESKCKVMLIGKDNAKFEYQMNNSELSVTDLEKDLGILVSSDLEWSQHINTAVGRANRQLGLI
jgi:hypothetical protein